VVLDSVSLRIDAGECIWLHGRNGAGKTTLLRTAAGVLRPEKGSVVAVGLDVERHRQQFHQQVQLLAAASAGLYARLRVIHHLQLWCSLAMLPRRQHKAAISRTVAAMDLDELLDRRVDRLSMGQRQRVRLAGTFLAAPRLLLLDEPANSLDDDGIRYLDRAVRATMADGGGVLWCSPSGQPPAGGYDAAWELRDGRLIAS
jgi:ABC-type multidrug transport system ATPase subunit